VSVSNKRSFDIYNQKDRLAQRDLPILLKNSYQDRETQNKIAAENGYARDSKSSVQTQILRKKGEAPIVVHRGSKNAHDYKDDFLIALGLGNHTHRVREGKRLNERLEIEMAAERKAARERGETEDPYGDPTGKSSATHVGHSLGGYLAQNTSSKNASVFTYNKHSVGLINPSSNPNQTDVIREGDLASIQSKFLHSLGREKSKTITKKGSRKKGILRNKLDTHSII